MIKLEKFEFCDDCSLFEPDVERPDELFVGEQLYCTMGDTIIRCEHRRACEHVVNHYKSKLKEESDGRKEM